MSVSCIQGQLLEVTVTSCTKLKDTEWMSRQDPYVCLEYGSTKYRSRTNTDGGKNPVFQDKFVFILIEGLKELKVAVWNSNIMKHDDFIGSGMIQLQKVLSQGFDDTAWPIHTQTGRHAGEVAVMMRFSQATKSTTFHSPSAPEYAYGASHPPHGPPYSALPPSTTPYAHPPAFYQAPSPAPYAHPPTPYQSPMPYSAYPPAPEAYPYHPTHPAAYPPPYAPPSSPYPLPPYAHTDPSYYSTGPYRGAYRPPYRKNL